MCKHTIDLIKHLSKDMLVLDIIAYIYLLFSGRHIWICGVTDLYFELTFHWQRYSL